MLVMCVRCSASLLGVYAQPLIDMLIKMEIINALGSVSSTNINGLWIQRIVSMIWGITVLGIFLGYINTFCFCLSGLSVFLAFCPHGLSVFLVCLSCFSFCVTFLSVLLLFLSCFSVCLSCMSCLSFYLSSSTFPFPSFLFKKKHNFFSFIKKKKIYSSHSHPLGQHISYHFWSVNILLCFPKIES